MTNARFEIEQLDEEMREKVKNSLSNGRILRWTGRRHEKVQKAETLLFKYRKEFNQHATIDSDVSLLSPPTSRS